ncbi:MAG: hypothetical protein ACQERB_04550 [Promethearchaeati archaeon]|nr:MAG: hypothetical protein EU543_03575 [Candidatus Lokiarchaeota archaeon]
MIVIFVDNIEKFIDFLDRRVMDEIFYEFKKIGKGADLSSNVEIEIIIHFLSKLEGFLILYETDLNLLKPSNSNIDEEVVKDLKRIFAKIDDSIKLTKGKIREIFLSYS